MMFEPSPGDIHFEGYCRLCWRRFKLYIPKSALKGMTMREIKEKINKMLTCCIQPDARF